MKKCPICKQSFTQTAILRRKFSQSTTNLLKEHIMDGKGVIRCPNCKARLRKKISIWFILAIIPFLFSVGLYTVEHQYEFLIILSIVFFMIVYISLPYVPYDT